MGGPAASIVKAAVTMFLAAANLVCAMLAAAITAAAAPGLPTPTPTPTPAQVAIDFSHAGYGAGAPLPHARAPVLLVRPGGADDTALLQEALDAAARLPRQADGFRGVVELAPARFRIAGQLHMNADGVVLRGSGAGAGQTVLMATGQGRRALILAGASRQPVTGAATAVSDEFVPAGALSFAVSSISGLRPGDRVVLTRPSTRAWIRDLGMDALPGTFAALRYHWPAGSRDLVWDRTVVAIDEAGGRVTLDAPVTTALERRYGGARLAKLTADAPLRQIGIERLAIDSEYERANPRDEEHAWDGIVLDHVEDAWVREVSGRHLVSSLVRVGPRARRVTVEQVSNAEPVGEPGGYRRLSFLVEGQQVLVQHCSADAGMNDFAIGFLAAGPNVFRDCRATHALGASGSYESWASGVLYEDVRVEGAGLRLGFDVDRAQGGGWTAANAVVWNSRAAEIEAAGPPGAPNLIVRSSQPLFAAQLAQRRGAEVAARVLAGVAEPAEVGKGKDAARGKVFSRTLFVPAKDAARPSAPVAAARPVAIRNGRFVVKGNVGDPAGERSLWGGSVNDAWWLGQTSPANARDAGMSITRFVPGRSGPGLTEDLAELAARVAAQGTPFYQSGPAIWYDRRRDDHTIATRPDAGVWGAFYELPWARSGKGIAQDGLSKYDLTRYNPWYFERVKTFARLCDEHGIVLYHHLYNNHNLLETAAHWTDYPWRPANNVNDTGLREPMPLEPNQRVHVAKQFYDVANPRLRALHRAYIFHVLDELGTHDNVIFGLAFQYSGPLAFQRFFQQTVAEWERVHARHVKLVLDSGKNVADGILADPELARQVAVIDMRYWHYLPDGSLWAPQAGQNRAFRELHPAEFGAPSTPELVYRQVREVAAAYPDKAIVSWHSGVGQIPALMAGGAQVLTRNPTAGHGQGREVDRTAFDGFVQQYLAGVLADMLPRDGWVKEGEREGERTWVLADEGRRSVLVYSLSGPTIGFTRALAQGPYAGLWFDPRTGRTSEAGLPAQFDRAIQVAKPDAREWLLLLRAR